MQKIRFGAVVFAIFAGVLTLGGCGAAQSIPSQTASTSESPIVSDSAAAWPRTVESDGVKVEIPAQPKKIISTTPSLTGTLLAMGAPLIGTACAPVTPLTDDKGYFSQWASLADAAGVKPLYTTPKFDLEALLAEQPDLVIVSSYGQDSLKDHYDEIAKHFPTVMINYADKSWQEAAQILGEATGLEAKVKEITGDFDAYVAAAKDKIKAPVGGVMVMGYNLGQGQSFISAKESAQAQILEQMGIDVVPLPKELESVERKGRADFASITAENLPQALTTDTIFLMRGTEKSVEQVLADPVLANVPAVKAKRVFPLGASSFRIDYFSGKAMVDAVVNALG